MGGVENWWKAASWLVVVLAEASASL